MKIKKVRIVNYKVFKEFEVEFQTESLTLLIGPNNVGKSTILEVIDLFFSQKSPVSSSFNSNASADELMEFEITMIKDSNETVLKTTFSNEGKLPKYYIDGDKKGTKEFKQAIENDYPMSYYVSPDTNAEDNEKNIQKLFRETAKDLAISSKNKNSFDDITTGIAELLLEAKNDLDQKVVTLTDFIRSDMLRIFGIDMGSLNIEVDIDGFTENSYAELLNSRIIFKKSDGLEYRLEDQGTGIRRVSFISLIHNAMSRKMLTFGKHKILLIDEPEVFLHPNAVRELSKLLYDISGETLQVIVSTHSPVLINLYEANNKSLKIMKIGNSAIDLYSSLNNRFEDDELAALKMLNVTNSYINEFFFSEKSIIVEGDTEYMLLNHFIDEYIKKNEGALKPHLINAKGKWTIPTLQKILNTFSAEYIVLHDLDTAKISPSNNLQQANGRIIEYSRLNNRSKVIANYENIEDTLYNLESVSNQRKTEFAYKLIKGEHESTHPDAYSSMNAIVKWIFGDEGVDLPNKVSQII